MKNIFLCAISNIASGSCNEDCGFCAQSIRWKADIERYKAKPIETIVNEAKAAKNAGAVGFCLVTAGKGVTDQTLAFVCEAARAVNAEKLELKLIACNGTATREQLRQMKQAGVKAYNHNLETSEKFYPQICTTHSWKERYETCENANAEGLDLVCGGIFGLGESDADRKDFLRAVKSLNPKTVPLNFFIANPALPIQQPVMATDEALFWVRRSREVLGEKRRIMLAGGKEQAFGDRLMEAVEAGANALVVGNYLTTAGMNSRALHDQLKNAGYQVAEAKNCKGE